jgi:hypothetical protein
MFHNKYTTWFTKNVNNFTVKHTYSSYFHTYRHDITVWLHRKRNILPENRTWVRDGVRSQTKRSYLSPRKIFEVIVVVPLNQETTKRRRTWNPIIYSLFDAVDNSDYAVSSGRMINEWWIETDMKGSGRGQLQCDWKDWREPLKPQSG